MCHIENLKEESRANCSDSSGSDLVYNLSNRALSQLVLQLLLCRDKKGVTRASTHRVMGRFPATTPHTVR